MDAITRLDPVDYLVVGHITLDVTPGGLEMGGTASYASLTAQALGLRVGVVTSWGEELPLGATGTVAIVNHPVERSTLFENLYLPQGRVQTVHHVARKLTPASIPEPWKTTPIVHLGPVAQEVTPETVGLFPKSLVGVTPQGWLRAWNEAGRVHLTGWMALPQVLPHANVTILSIEDLAGDEEQIEEMASFSQVLVVTEGANGARVYWSGDVRRFAAPAVVEVNATGAGDIFAAAFLVRYHKTHDPWEAARFANQLAAQSVTRHGLDSIPKPDEIKKAMIEVF